MLQRKDSNLSFKKCYICGGQDLLEKDYIIREDPKLKIIECLSCGLWFLSSFSHISNDYYKSSLMQEPGTIKDILYRLRGTGPDDERRYQYLKSLLINKRLLDYGCGIGGFLFKSSVITKESHGVDPDRKFSSFIKDRGHIVFDDIGCISVNECYDIITMFHVIEHLPDPMSNLREIKNYMGENSRLIIEVPSSDDILFKLYENEAFSKFQYDCHLYIYNQNSIRLLLEKSGFKVEYVKQVQRYSIANHLYWLAKGHCKGHVVWNFLDSDTLHKEYEKNLASVGMCDTLIVSAYI